MSLPYRFRSLFFLMSALAVVCGCKKNNSSDPNPPPTNLPAAVTPIGTPVGTATSKSIGATGGTIMSADGRVELSIPAGALAANTNIIIQPVTNEAPNGIGLAYDFLPNGTKFTKPVTLTFHYTDEDVPDNVPYYLYIAYQDSAHKWKPDMIQRDFDTVAKTVSLDINHFTIYSFGDGIKVTANPAKVSESEVSVLTVTETVVVNEEGLTETNVLTSPSAVLGEWRVNGKVSGDEYDGTISSAGVYLSPQNIPFPRTVYATVRLKVKDQAHYKKGKKITPQQADWRGTGIKLEPYREYKYTVLVTVLDSTVSPFYNGKKTDIPVYIDTSRFDITLKLRKHAISYEVSTPKNNPPAVNPNTYTFAGIEYIWLPDVVGMLNISKVEPEQLLAEDSVVRIFFQHNNAVLPGYIHKNSDGVTVHSSPPVPFGNPIGIPQLIKLDLKKRGPHLYTNGMYGSYQYAAYIPKE